MSETDDATVTALAIRVFGRACRNIHDKMRTLVAGMDAEALNWKPHPEASSIAVIVTHTLGSERELLAAVRGIKVPRDRPSEFKAEADTARLESLIDEADLWLDQQVSPLTAADLTSLRRRGEDEEQPGIVWLITNYGHAREHLAQIELTKQLYAAGR